MKSLGPISFEVSLLALFIENVAFAGNEDTENKLLALFSTGLRKLFLHRTGKELGSSVDALVPLTFK